MNRTELVDCHTHTTFSDGKSTLEENMCAAIQGGLTTIACTDHWGKPAFIDCSIEKDKLDVYADAVKAVQDQFPELTIIYGIEADWYDGCESDLVSLRSSIPFMLGSIHYLEEKSIDWDQDMRIWDEYGADGVWKRYADQWCKAATSGLFDSMAHPDLPRLFSTEGYAPTIDLNPLWDAMAEAAREGNVHVEINTAGLIKPFKDFYPCTDLLQRFAHAEVPLTVGSDAHSASRIGSNILDAYCYAYQMGYRSIDVPTKDGSWRSIRLENLTQ